MKFYSYLLFVLLVSSYSQAQTNPVSTTLTAFTAISSTTVTSSTTVASTTASNDSPIIAWLKNNKISIRKTFDGSNKDEAKPATFFHNKDYSNNSFYTTIDVGLKIPSIELTPNSLTKIILFYPKIEWHKDTRTIDPRNTLTTGINIEYYPFGIKSNTRFFILGSADYQNNYITKKEVTKFKGFLSLFGTKGGAPGSQIRAKNNALVLRYYPYIGLEYYKKIGDQSQEAMYWANRLFFELWPLPFDPKRQYIQITFDYTYRSHLNGELYEKKDTRWVSIGLNFYPDGVGNFGFGVEYSEGFDPTNDFVYNKKLTYGLKVKF